MERERADGREENRVRESSSRPGDSGRRGWCEDGECGRAWRSGRAIPLALSSLSLSLRGRWAGPSSRFSEGPLPTLSLVSSRRVAWASPVVLALDPGVCHEGARVRRQPASGATQVVVDLHDLLNARRDQQGRRQPLLHRKNDALARSDPDRGRSKLCRANERERKKRVTGKSVQVQQKRVRSSSAVSLTGRPEPWRSSLP